MSEDTSPSDRQILLSRLLDAVKQCQIRFGGRKELATESDSRVVNLCTQFEAVLQHGMKKSKGLSSIRQVSEIVKGLNLWNTDSDYVFWHYVRSHLTRHELERYLVLRHVTSDEGRGRAWLRSALNEHALERYMHMLVADPAHISQFYEDSAFLMDQEKSSMLPTMSAGLGAILFAINIDNPDLNPPESSVAVRAPMQAGLSDARPVIAKGVGVEGKRKKKRRKPRSNVVSFDDEDEDDFTPGSRFMGHHSCFSAPATCVSSPVASEFPAAGALPADSAGDPADDNGLEGAAPPTGPEDAHSVESLATSDGNLSDERDQSPRGQPSAAIPVERVKTWSGSTESSGSPRPELPRSGSSSPLSHSKEGAAAGSHHQPSSLTPILDLSIGDLIPVCHPSEDTARSEDSIPSYSEDTETAAAALVLAQNVSSLALNAVESPGPAAAETELAADMTSATPEELKQALLVMTQRIKDVEQENSALRRMVEQESEVSARLRADAQEAERQATERVDKHEARIQTLTRENQLLKHQLKKYIAAVQLLKRDGLAAHQELHQMVGDVEPAIPDAKPYIDHQFEASEYEKKLVQVAEMHGELMEFNERLHRLLLFRECTIRRLREELTDLRGPLPDENQTSDDDLSVTSDYDASSQSASLRPLINLWIPSAFLAGHQSHAFHVYQVYVRIRDDEWNVYRRYSQFYALHKQLCKHNPIVCSFDFPPKKSIGNKDAKIVEERRQRLQRYLRSVLNFLAQTSQALVDSPDRATLVKLLPFFREQDTTHSQARQARRTAQRLRVPVASAMASPSQGNSSQTPVRHYMGH
ncbi:sorting nexin-29 [Haemaphysalis longicornis]